MSVQVKYEPNETCVLRISGAQKSALARHIALAEMSMSERVKEAASDLRASGKTTFAS
jgi:ABC-type arginine transport system ATPase subunit